MYVCVVDWIELYPPRRDGLRLSDGGTKPPRVLTFFCIEQTSEENSDEKGGFGRFGPVFFLFWLRRNPSRLGGLYVCIVKVDLIELYVCIVKVDLIELYVCIVKVDLIELYVCMVKVDWIELYVCMVKVDWIELYRTKEKHAYIQTVVTLCVYVCIMCE